MTDPRAEYRSRLARCDADIARGDRAYNRIAAFRGVTGLLAAVLGVLAIRSTLSWWWLALPGAIFLGLVVVHERIARRNEQTRRARRLYARGVARLDGRWAGTGADGARFLRDHDHPFARDLDLFGPASLFQFLNTTQTEVGEDTLAAWLLQSAPLPEINVIVARQAAIDELRPMIDYRESIGVIAPDAHASRTGPLARLAATPPVGFSSAARVVFAVLTGFTVVVILALAFRVVPAAILLAWIVLEWALVLPWRRPVRDAERRVDVAVEDLRRLKGLLARVEAQRFTSPYLASLARDLGTGGIPPSQAVARLERLVSLLDSCRNQMFLPIALVFLIRQHTAVAIDRWHATFGPAIVTWLRAIGELEALSALATYAFEHPSDVFPDLVVGETIFEAQAVAHPLLLESIEVRNDVRLGGPNPHVLIVSGSNMSGKSTVLRAVGVNVVLALAGAPVRAARLRLSRLALGATLRIEDSLQEGHSRFYAEILRLRAIVDIARASVPLLFLLDEILGGTNSHDRQLGAQAVVSTLLQDGAIGLVTTHDLALTEMADSLGAPASNVHFEDHLEDGRLVFDYVMRPGVVARGNALELMRMVGLSTQGS